MNDTDRLLTYRQKGAVRLEGKIDLTQLLDNNNKI